MSSSSTADARQAAATRHMQSGAYRAAIQLYETLLDETPNDATVLNDAAIAYAQNDQPQKAEAYLRRALEVQPDYEPAFYNLIDLLLDGRRDLDAQSIFETYRDDIPASTDKSTYREKLGVPIPAHQGDGAPAAQPEADTLRIAFVCGPDRKFITDIEREIGTRHEVRTAYFDDKVNLQQIQRVMDWADVTWFEWCDKILVHASKKLRKTSHVACRLHGYEVFSGIPQKVNWSFIDQLIFVAEHKRRLFNQQVHSAAVDQTLIRNGVNLDQFTIPSGKRNTKKLLLLGNLNYRKGLPMLMQFFSELLQHDPDFQLVIRGAWQDHRYKMAVETLIRELRITDHIEFVTEWIDDLGPWLADKSHILSFSLEESFHYAIGNSMAAGLKPVVHAWNESRDTWPEQYIFKNCEEFLSLVLEDRFSPTKYRQDLVDLGYTLDRQIDEIEQVFRTLGRAPQTVVDAPNIGASSENVDRIGSTHQDYTGLDRRISANAEERNHVFIVAQHRSGSTIFWKTLRQNEKMTCYDEPFRPHLRQYVTSGVDDKKKTMGEYLQRPDLIEEHWSTIQPYEEVLPTLVSHQLQYLKALEATGPYVCMDFVRCSAKIKHLRESFPDALIIHLVRDPRAWVTSHMRPYGDWLQGLPNKFFDHSGWFNFWHRQDLANHLGLKGHTHEKLLQVWNRLVAAAEAATPDMTIQFEHFAQHPRAVVEIICEHLSCSVDVDAFDFSGIHPPNAPFALNDERWVHAIAKYVSDENKKYMHDFSHGIEDYQPSSG
jgi:glycosyltransferase involved in cell wall biosynthesis